MYCIYCGWEKEVGSREHVFPGVLGGVIGTANPFLLPICRRCNNSCGRYIDGPFAHSFFVNSLRAANAGRYANVERGEIIPLIYQGVLNNLSVTTEYICEFLLGPTGDGIYHFHRPYCELPFGSGYLDARTHMRAEEYDNGFVMVIMRANNPLWHQTIYNSIRNRFQVGTPIFYLNVQSPQLSGHDDVPTDLIVYRDAIYALAGQQHNITQTIYPDYGVRFMAKLALGFGGLFLDPCYARSSEANVVRQILWSRNPAARYQSELHGTNFLEASQEPIVSRCGWDAGHVFIFQPINDYLALQVILYGSQTANIQITSNRAHWERSIGGDAMVYVLCPSIHRVVGPVSLAQFIAVRNGFSRTGSELADVFNEMVNAPSQPPFDI